MLAFYVEWHIKETWSEITFADTELGLKATRDPVAPARRPPPPLPLRLALSISCALSECRQDATPFLRQIIDLQGKCGQRGLELQISRLPNARYQNVYGARKASPIYYFSAFARGKGIMSRIATVFSRFTDRIVQLISVIRELLQWVPIYIPPELRGTPCTQLNPYDGQSPSENWFHPYAVRVADKLNDISYLCPYCQTVVSENETIVGRGPLKALLMPPPEDDREIDRHSRMAYSAVGGVSVLFLIHCLTTENSTFLHNVATLFFALAIPLAIAAVLIVELCIYWKFRTPNSMRWQDIVAVSSGSLSFLGIALLLAAHSWFFALAFLFASLFAFVAVGSCMEERWRITNTLRSVEQGSTRDC